VMGRLSMQQRPGPWWTRFVERIPRVRAQLVLCAPAVAALSRTLHSSQRLAWVLIATLMVSGCGAAVALANEAQAALTPSSVLDQLEAANERFVNDESLNRDFAQQVQS